MQVRRWKRILNAYYSSAMICTDNSNLTMAVIGGNGESSIERLSPFLIIGFLLDNLIYRFSQKFSPQMNNLNGLLINVISVF